MSILSIIIGVALIASCFGGLFFLVYITANPNIK